MPVEVQKRDWIAPLPTDCLEERICCLRESYSSQTLSGQARPTAAESVSQALASLETNQYKDDCCHTLFFVVLVQFDRRKLPR